MLQTLGTFKGSNRFTYTIKDGTVFLEWCGLEGTGSATIPVGVIVDLYEEADLSSPVVEVGEDSENLGYCLL